MNVPIWMLLISPPVIFVLGFLVCAMVTAGKVDDLRIGLALAEGEADAEHEIAKSRLAEAMSANEAHARCDDSRNTLLSRIDRLKSIALSQQSVKSGRIVAVLNGEA